MWVVTWEGTFVSKSKREEVVICFHQNMRVEEVGRRLELLYIAEKGHREEKIMYAKEALRRLPDVFRARVGSNHIVSCGHNPHLVAERKAFLV